MNPFQIILRKASPLLVGVALTTFTGCPPQKAALIGENGQILVATGFWKFELREDLSGNTQMYIFELNADHTVEQDGTPYPAAWNQIGDEFLLAESVDVPNAYIYEADVRSSYALSGDYFVRINGNEFKAGKFTADFLPAQTEIDGPVEQAPIGVL